MTPLHPLRIASTALALLAILCTHTAVSAQTAASGWPWGTGYERRQAPATGPLAEPVPDTPLQTTANTGSGAAGKSQGAGHSGSRSGAGNGGASGGGRGR